MNLEPRTFSDKFWLVCKGLAMGAANKVPGVSGGIVAYVVGFYEEFIHSLQKVNGNALKLLLNGRFRSFFHYINGRFLGLLILGMLISYFSVSKLLDLAISNYPLYVWSTFFGMIIGSIYYIAKDFEDWNQRNILVLFLGVCIGVGISLLEPATQNDNLFFVFFCGIVGVSGMTLPGLSGSFLLILMGNYVLLLVDSVNALYDTLWGLLRWDFSFLENAAQVRLLKVLALFTLGSVVGLVTLSNFLGFLLKKLKNETNAIIIGFITGSLGVVWPWKEFIYERNLDNTLKLDREGDPILQNYDRFWPNEFTIENLAAMGFIIFGVLVVFSLGKYGEKNKENRNGQIRINR